MIPDLQSLFRETNDCTGNIPERYKKRMSRAVKYIKNYELLPDLPCPPIGSKVYDKDMQVVVNSYDNPNLPQKFLTKSHDSVKNLFKEYCQKFDLRPSWKNIGMLLDDVKTIIAHQKFKYNKPRPKEMLGDEYCEIPPMDSPSFPSGHTASAYFIATMLSNVYNEHKNELMKLAGLIGQSRIENGVHYPSDVLYGRFIGETLASLCTSTNLNSQLLRSETKKKDVKKCVKSILRSAKEPKQAVYNLAEFIQLSNVIEKYNISFDDCYDACLNFLQGYPIEDCTTNSYIESHLKCIVKCHKLKPINNPYKYIHVHKDFNPECLEKGHPGEIRMTQGHASSGNAYSEPSNILNYLSQIHTQKNPYVKHILYEWIHPFLDGNGRTGRIILLVDTNFDFSNVLNFCADQYIENIVKYVDHFKDIKNILKH